MQFNKQETDIRLLAVQALSDKDPFFNTQAWLHSAGFEYDDLIVVQKADRKTS